MTNFQVIRRALVTEKGHDKKENERTLVFEVTSEATKTQVKTAVARGSSLDDTRAAIRMDAAQAALCKGDPWCQNGFAGVFVAPAVARAYREAKEGPLHDED